MPSIVAATPEHYAALAPLLRAADVAECIAAGSTPRHSLALTFAPGNEGPRFTILDDAGAPIGAFGAVERFAVRPGLGVAWLVGTDALVSTHRRWMIQNTPAILSAAGDRLKAIFGMVDARNVKHVRWLRWAGFVVLDAIPWGPSGMPFRPFYRRLEVSEHV